MQEILVKDNKFRIYWTNSFYCSERVFASLYEAIYFAKSTTFDFQIYQNGRLLASGDFFNGVKFY